MAEGSGGSFVSKPPRGWLHPDSILANDGVTYAVRVSICDIPVSLAESLFFKFTTWYLNKILLFSAVLIANTIYL